MDQVMIQRFEAKVERIPFHTCWEWVGGAHELGYGRMWDAQARRNRPAHHLAYEHYVGPIPDGMVLDHLCRNPSCVNPAHLEAVLHAENLHRGNSTGWRMTTCKRGHPWDEANTLILTRKSNGRARRECRACSSLRMQRFHARREAGDN